MKVRWTNEEKQIFLSYCFSNDNEDLNEVFINTQQLMYLEGNHPNFKHIRSISSLKNMYYKTTHKILS